MKRMIALAICICFVLMSGMAFASNTGGSSYDEPMFNRWFNHDHNYSQTSKYKAPLGFGVDLTLYEMDVKGVGLGFGVDTEYDVNNGVFGTFGKVRVNTTSLINKIIGK